MDTKMAFSGVGETNMKKENWKKKKKSEIEEKFLWVANAVLSDVNLSLIADMIPFQKRKDFVIDWHSKDHLDQ